MLRMSIDHDINNKTHCLLHSVICVVTHVKNKCSNPNTWFIFIIHTQQCRLVSEICLSTAVAHCFYGTSPTLTGTSKQKRNSDLGLLDEVVTHGLSAGILFCDLRLQAYRAPVVNHGSGARGQPPAVNHGSGMLKSKCILKLQIEMAVLYRPH